jgi:hypothetical protein
MQRIIFDIETGPLPDAELLDLLPPFDEAEVKCGNLKDPDKIADKIREAKNAHFKNFVENAALDPLTGQVLAIGMVIDGVTRILAYPEPETLECFWSEARGDMERVNPLVGFNIFQFDLPFLIKRSWKYGIQVPRNIRRGRYWGEGMVDLREVWQLGDRQARGSLDAICRHLGLGKKTGSGKDFARLFAEDRYAALEYLRNDLRLTAKLAERLNVFI